MNLKYVNLMKSSGKLQYMNNTEEIHVFEK